MHRRNRTKFHTLFSPQNMVKAPPWPRAHLRVLVNHVFGQSVRNREWRNSYVHSTILSSEDAPIEDAVQNIVKAILEYRQHVATYSLANPIPEPMVSTCQRKREMREGAKGPALNLLPIEGPHNTTFDTYRTALRGPGKKGKHRELQKGHAHLNNPNLSDEQGIAIPESVHLPRGRKIQRQSPKARLEPQPQLSWLEMFGQPMSARLQNISPPAAKEPAPTVNVPKKPKSQRKKGQHSKSKGKERMEPNDRKSPPKASRSSPRGKSKGPKAKNEQ